MRCSRRIAPTACSSNTLSRVTQCSWLASPYAIAISIIVVLNAIIGFAQERKAERALAALKLLGAPTARVIRSREHLRIASRELVPGDLVELAEGDRVPADARLFETEDLVVDEAALTGESVPVDKLELGDLAVDTPLAQRTNMVFSGTHVVRGRAKAFLAGPPLLKAATGEIATDEELAALRAFVERSRDVPEDSDATRLLELDEAFHLTLARYSRNDEFVRALESVNARIHFVRWIDMQNGRQDRSIALGVAENMIQAHPNLGGIFSVNDGGAMGVLAAIEGSGRFVAALLTTLLTARTASAETMTLMWDANPEPEVVGYVVHVGTQSGSYTQHIDVGLQVTWVFPGAAAGQRYCFTVSAYAMGPLEGPNSAEVCGYSNTPPTLVNPGNQASVAGEPATLQLSGSDPDGTPVTYGATGLPPGLTLMASTGFISGTPTASGSYNVTASVSDGVLTTSRAFTWSVNGRDSAAPVVTITTPTAAATRRRSSARPTAFWRTSDAQLMLFWSFEHLDWISPRLVLFITGGHAHSRIFSEHAFKKASEPKELYIVPGAGHVDRARGAGGRSGSVPRPGRAGPRSPPRRARGRPPTVRRGR